MLLSRGPISILILQPAGRRIRVPVLAFFWNASPPHYTQNIQVIILQRIADQACFARLRFVPIFYCSLPSAVVFSGQILASWGNRVRLSCACKLLKKLGLLVEQRGIEPLTSALRIRRSSNTEVLAVSKVAATEEKSRFYRSFPFLTIAY